MNNKIAIGCLIQWYEIELVEEYLQSVKNAVDMIDNKKDIIIDLYFNIDETLEKIEDFPVEEINQTQVKQEDDFIMDINEMESSEPVQPISQEPESIPETIEEQSTPETEEVQEEKRVFANPIEKIDLSSFFKFG